MYSSGSSEGINVRNLAGIFEMAWYCDGVSGFRSIFFANLDSDFRSRHYSNLNHRNCHPKSRSLDLGMESVGLSDDEPGKWFLI